MLMRWLIGIAALLLMTAVSRSVCEKDVARISPADRVPAMDYRWWQRASGEERLTAIAIAIGGLRTGWTFGGDGQLGAVSDNLKEAYAQHKVSMEAIAIATQPRSFTPPVFRKPLGVYRSKIDGAYARVPSMRKQDVAIVLLCFADSPIITCRDGNGKVLR
jgi:hypothetical protein